MTDHINQLLDIMRKLRDPETGCAWDIKQDFASIAAFTLEEAYEVVDAIERNDFDDLKDELGDLLLQVVFHAQMASERQLFDFDDVAQAISDKMLRRHPHVFSDVTFASEAELKASWELIKSEERRLKIAGKGDALQKEETGLSEHASALDGVAANLPALKRADKVQIRAARAGFDWPEIAPVWDKLAEEIAEVREAIDARNKEAVVDEIGDLLFTVVNLARHVDIDSESALRQATAKFEMRFRLVENFALLENRSLADLSLIELDVLWNRAKDV